MGAVGGRVGIGESPVAWLRRQRVLGRLKHTLPTSALLRVLCKPADTASRASARRPIVLPTRGERCLRGIRPCLRLARRRGACWVGAPARALQLPETWPRRVPTSDTRPWRRPHSRRQPLRWAATHAAPTGKQDSMAGAPQAGMKVPRLHLEALQGAREGVLSRISVQQVR